MTDKNKGGRPRIEFNENMWKQIERLCGLHCTGEEIASVIDVDYDTLNARIRERYGYGFSDYFKRRSGSGKASLRRMQFKLADDGNATMLIWLGKQYLGQSDKVIQDTVSSDGSMTPATALDMSKLSTEALAEIVAAADAAKPK